MKSFYLLKTGNTRPGLASTPINTTSQQTLLPTLLVSRPHPDQRAHPGSNHLHLNLPFSLRESLLFETPCWVRRVSANAPVWVRAKVALRRRLGKGTGTGLRMEMKSRMEFKKRKALHQAGRKWPRRIQGKSRVFKVREDRM